MRTFGVEEELLLVDPKDGRAVSRAPQVLAIAHEAESDGALDPELFQHQVETQTPPLTSADDLLRHLEGARRTAAAAAAPAGLALVACGVAPLSSDDNQVTQDDRYRQMAETYGDIARYGGTCAMHVHVGIDSPEEGVAVIDRVRPWLPVLLALSVNSPFAEGRDTGYASWRSQLWSQWPSAGPVEAFETVRGYRQVSEALIATGAARDTGMLYFDARLSEHAPTVEIRVCDVVTEPEDAVLVAVLTRGLVETAARDRAPQERQRVELQRAARWRSSRHGLSGQLVRPGGHELVPATDAVDMLVQHVGPALGDDDAALVREGVQRMVSADGATRQRVALERTGSVFGVVEDLVTRSAASPAT